jgi:YD repeat-containing protein
MDTHYSCPFGKDASTTVAQYAYNSANGSLSQISWADGVTQQYLYDANGRLQENNASFGGVSV